MSPSRIKVVDVELNVPPEPLGDLDKYEALRALVHLHSVPIGHVEVPLLPGTLYTAVDLRRVILRSLTYPILCHHVLDLTATPLPPEAVNVEELLETPHPTDGCEYAGHAAPLVTVAVCTRDRTESLKLCLDSLLRLDYPNLDILVVDNAPSSDISERLIKDLYPGVRYIREPRPGLDWARNRAILEGRGEIIAYTDDDVVVDPGWVSALVGRFLDSNAMSVTGLTVPYELETEAQVLSERHSSFNRGYLRRYFPETPLELSAGRCGAGANMAFRRGTFEEVGYFDPALDAGTLTRTGGDTEMFFRILKEGHTIAYEPGALVRHRHRRDYAQLRQQMIDNIIGTFSYLVRVALAYPEVRLSAIRLGVWWFWYWNIRRLIASFARFQPPTPPDMPRELMLAELWYSFVALGRYHKASRVAESISKTVPNPRVPPPKPASPRKQVDSKRSVMGVRTVDLGRPLHPLEDVTSYTTLRVFVILHGKPLGFVDIPNHRRSVGVLQLRDAVANQLPLQLLRRERGESLGALWENAQNALERRYLPESAGTSKKTVRLPDSVSVSIVIPTYDRPGDLRDCLLSLNAQATKRPLEIIVVDNHSASGLTPPVVAKFPGVRLVSESRRGRSYASNKGFAVASGEIIVSIDDDMMASPEWLENLIAPLVRAEVAAVTGNTLPVQLDTPAQRLFEKYLGFWRGADRWDADSEWFRSFHRSAVRTPLLGGTGNVAFRSSILAHPQIGLMDEALGAGMPTGTGEDTYLFYKVLRAGYTIAYEPSAYAWHKHRREMRAMRKQIYDYSKGHVAYHLVTLLRDRDLRVVWELGYRKPRWHLRVLARYAKMRLLREPDYFPLSLALAEILGAFLGPWSLWRSYQRVKREGRSSPYVLSPPQTPAKNSIRVE